MRNGYGALSVALVLGVGLGSAGLASAHAAPRAPQLARSSGGTWTKAIEVPGLRQLNTRNSAALVTVSCPAPGDCGAGGSYTHKGQGQQGFVVSEHGGTWGKAIEVPGLASLNVGRGAGIGSVSCAAIGYCSAGGSYTDKSGKVQAFVVTERHGVWGKAIEVPGSAGLNPGGGAFVVTQGKGVWGKAVALPGLGKLTAGADAAVDTVSCAAPGDCSAGGYYTAKGIDQQAFVATQSKGVWGKAIEVPGSGKLNTGGGAEVDSVSCAAPGDCSAGGGYLPKGGFGDAFVVTQSKGVWGKAIEVPGTSKLNGGQFADAETESVSCAAPGDCSAGGYYTAKSGDQQALVVTQRDGRWGTAIAVPGSVRLNRGGSAEIDSVSCATPGDCSAGGEYADSLGDIQALVVTQTNGAWGKAIEVPGSAKLGGFAETLAVSCATPVHCGAGGGYLGGGADGNFDEAFVVTQR
jgi:hypothetical protein